MERTNKVINQNGANPCDCTHTHTRTLYQQWNSLTRLYIDGLKTNKKEDNKDRVFLSCSYFDTG